MLPTSELEDSNTKIELANMVEELSPAQTIANTETGDEGGQLIDRAVIDKLPLGTVVHSSRRLGTSEWTVLTKLETTDRNNEPKSYFLKCAPHEHGRIMLEGEFHSMKALYEAAPTFVPKPHGWGLLTGSEQATYFFLCDFLELSNEFPEPNQLCEKLVALHKSSQSSNNMFGFHIKPMRGNLQLETTWNPSWISFFIQLLRSTLELDQKTNGTWSNLEQLVDDTITHIVPQVLGPLVTKGRSIKPSLIHGDLWDGNIGTNAKTGDVYIFDASAYYAHHEMEIAIWRPLPNSVVGSGVYVETYLKYMGISEPKEQFEDRHMLYSACTALHAAACHNRLSAREECSEKLTILIGKYCH
ncbi:hypothetical protein K491DRAFT_640794 [Lophiostoma macrostomum CBS 122681]|uniref:protein-ribulosamine 3-kinase n=1 Tax=Lophiostoma macrostomum CBS 122681 TaxID=1314788 RepID=A0A6A6SNL1_9PLEO|nr:hypothetical protein K491DRAFT_640794 [Lophiostoma macrostomum CBS 122681]